MPRNRQWLGQRRDIQRYMFRDLVNGNFLNTHILLHTAAVTAEAHKPPRLTEADGALLAVEASMIRDRRKDHNFLAEVQATDTLAHCCYSSGKFVTWSKAGTSGQPRRTNDLKAVLTHSGRHCLASHHVRCQRAKLGPVKVFVQIWGPTSDSSRCDCVSNHFWRLTHQNHRYLTKRFSPRPILV